MVKPPKVPTSKYDQTILGSYGEFGSGGGLQAFYLQASIKAQSINKLSLVSELKGSERWPVRELFQRDVDIGRIHAEAGLIEYLKGEEKIKFFNPLTITVLPMDESGLQVESNLTRVTETEHVDADNLTWEVLERSPYYRFSWIKNQPAYAKLDYESDRSKLVAIDGQHRLFALRSIHEAASMDKDAYQDFLNWRIPIVIVSFKAETTKQDPPTVLQVVRNLFMYINSTAQSVSLERQILLSDESINSVITQELLDYCHKNDLKPIDERDDTKIPLLFFDWRGEEHMTQRVSSPSAVKAITEVCDWLKHYILGEDLSKDQKNALGVEPKDALHSAFHNEYLSYHDSEEVREVTCKPILHGIAYLFEEFLPFKKYIENLRQIESEQKEAHDHTGELAFHQLRFGTSRGLNPEQPGIQEKLREVSAEIESCKNKHLDSPLREDIGLRGIVWAYGDIPYYFEYEGMDWVEYSEWFVDTLNEVWSDGWFIRRGRSRKRKLLKHILEDENLQISGTRYKIDQAHKYFGPYVALFISTYGQHTCFNESWRAGLDAYRDELMDTLQSTLEREYRRYWQKQLRTTQLDDEERKKEVDKKKRADAKRQISNIRKAIETIVVEKETEIVD